jgi:hypothetical protein
MQHSTLQTINKFYWHEPQGTKNTKQHKGFVKLHVFGPW